MSPEALGAIARVLKESSGFSLEHYKDKCVQRRIAIRMRATQAPSAEAYHRLLLSDREEQESLLKVLTIHVSQFFRNPSTFTKLSREILPAILKGRRRGEEVRFWSVGCAAGEEPYSLALILKECFAPQLSRLNLSIVGSDVDATVLEQAQQGCYGAERLAELTEGQLRQWFRPVGGRFQLAQEIRDLVRFSRVDLNQPQTYLRSDLILCRNVFIYFERKRQGALQIDLAEALNPGGLLVLGKSETLVGEARRSFTTVCPVERIYQRV